MLWAPVIAAGLSAAGAGLGQSERPTLDPNLLKKLFGPEAVGADAQLFFQRLLNSPAFTQIMRSAGLQGSQLNAGINRNLGISGAQGSPIAAFAKAAGRGYSGALQTPAMSDLFLKSLTAAMGNNDMRAGLWGQSQLMKQGTPTFSRMVGSSLLNAGATGFSNWFDKKVG